MKRFELSVSLVAVCLVLSSVAFPQASSSSLRGTVTDPSGSAIPGATVVIANPDSKLTRTATTGGLGDYQFLSLPPGTYMLTITATGFARYEQTGVQLLVNSPATSNVQLRIGRANESVTVSSEAPVLNEVDASLGNSFDQTQVREIPIEGRNVAELLSLQAGVAYTGNRQDIDKDQDSRNGSVNGARSDQSNITLDGVDVNDQVAGYAFTSVLPTTLDSVQEFRVTTANYNADQGTGSGAQVALITKSGTNKLHGSLYEYHRNTITSTNDYFVKGAEARSGAPNVPDKLIRNIFGVSLGGPIRKDRLFFFANYEGTRRREEQSTVRTIPSPSLCAGNINYQDASGNLVTVTPSQLQQLDPLGIGINPAIENAGHTGYFDKTFCTGQFVTNDPSVGDGFNYSGYRFRAPVKEDNNAFIARVDYHLSADGKHSLFWRGNLQNLSNPQAPFLPGSPPEQTLTDHSKGFALGYTALLSRTMVNTATWGFTRQSTGFVGNTTQEWNVFYGLDQGIVYGHNAQVPVNNFLDDFSWTKGKHALQFGGNFGIVRDPRVSLEHSFSLGKGATNWMSPTGFANTGGSYLDPANIGLAEPGSTFAYDYPVLGLLGMVSDIVANYNYDKQLNVLPKGTPIKRNYGLEWYEFYGQDSWRIKPNLTVTFGLRWSLFPPPWEVNGYQASPDVNLGQQFDQIVKNMNQGIGYYSVPLLSFVPGGRANNGPGFYSSEKSDFSPRFSFAYSPRPAGGWLKSLFGEGDKTVIRGGFSKVYDRSGMQLLRSASNFRPLFSHAPLLSILLVWQVVPWLVSGFESVGKCAEEANPNFEGRNFSVAILLTIFAGLAFFWVVIAAVSYVAPWQSLNSNQQFPTAVAFENALHAHWIVVLIMGSALVALIQAFNANMVASSRLLYAMSRRNLLNPRISRVHPVNRTPSTAIIAVGAATALAIFLGEALLIPILEVGAVTAAVAWMAACASYYRMKPPWPRRSAAIFGLIVTSAMILVKLVPLVPGHFTSHEWVALAIWGVLGAAVRTSRQRDQRQEPEMEVASVES